VIFATKLKLLFLNLLIVRMKRSYVFICLFGTKKIQNTLYCYCTYWHLPFLIVINLLEASICVFDKNFDCIERIIEAFLLCEVESNLIFNASLLLLFASTLLSFM